MMNHLRRVMGGSLRAQASAMPRRGLEEFFPTQTAAQQSGEQGADQPAAPGTRKVETGGDWKAWMLRQKSTDDLHKLWYVLLKERNALNTERQSCRTQNISMPNPERRTKVKKSMARLKLVLHERSQIYKAKQNQS